MIKNNSKIIIFAIFGFILALGASFFINQKNAPAMKAVVKNATDQIENIEDQLFTELSIEGLRKKTFPGSEITVVETLSKGSNYTRYRVSYESEGYTIYALMTVPDGDTPENGWPTIVFNHGYIAPTEYRTTEKYVAYQDAFARAGYISFKSDYRGHGESEGEPFGAYGSEGYTTDILNAISSLKKDARVNKNKIGMWGHSMGGYITLRSMVVSKDIKAGVIWAGVVGSHAEMLNNWRRRQTSPPSGLPTGARRWRDALITAFGTPENNPKFWNSISATAYVKDISGPMQIHHGTADSTVPLEFSTKLKDRLEKAGKTVEYYEYVDDDHNISRNFTTAIRRSVEFFDTHLK